MSSSNFSRRKFLSGAATVGAASAMGIGAFTSCSGGGEKAGISGIYDFKSRELNLPPMLDIAPDGWS